ncbi:MAG: hypothetical protein COB02_01095 [Candidatus Cloacimonadota bacterium]|nr:MAG: hypothetical protein COB02_01095 [Candidatus Cloacimonadota bacterium]
MHQQERDELIFICKLLYDRGLLCGMDGNVSMRVSDGFLTTPSGRNKYFIKSDDLVHLNKQGISIEYNKKPSSEFEMHKKVYDMRCDVNAIVHCHPVYSTFFASSKYELDICLLTEAVVAQGAIPKAKLAIPSTSEIANSIAPFVDKADAILLANHGAITYGKNLEVAYSKMDSLEHFAKIQYMGLGDNSLNTINPETVELLEGMRDGYGLTTPCIPCNQKTDRSDKSLNEDEIVKQVLFNLSNRN